MESSEGHMLDTILGVAENGCLLTALVLTIIFLWQAGG